MNSIILTIEFILLITSLPISAKFFINTQPRNFGDTQKCPPGFKLADLNSQVDWKFASKLALDTLGPGKAAWINSGQTFEGTGHEQWTLLTSNAKCEFPPKDMKSFCLPIFWSRMSPNFDSVIELPSICQEDIKKD